MDASHDVARDAKSATTIRREVYATADDLRGKLEEFGEYVHERLGTFDDPLHIKELITARPLVACGAALAIGFVCGAMRARFSPFLPVKGAVKLSSQIMGGIGRAVGAQVVSGILDSTTFNVTAQRGRNILK